MPSQHPPTRLSNISLAERAYHALLMGQVQGQGYIGQALGVADVLAVAYLSPSGERA